MDVIMPQLGETVEEGRVSLWYKKLGDRVKPGDNLFDVETDKASMEVPAVCAGVLTEIRVAAGAVVPVGAVVAVISEPPGADVESPPVAESWAGPAGVSSGDSSSSGSLGLLPAQPSDRATVTAHPQPRSARVIATSPARNYGAARLPNGTPTTPYARRLAGEANISLAEIRGSGSQGLILGKDVLAHLAATHGSGSATLRAAAAVKEQYAGTRYSERTVDSMRAAIARRLTESKQTVPHFYLTVDLDIGRFSRRREALNARVCSSSQEPVPVKVSVNDLVIEAWAGALKSVPAANAVWAEGQVLEFDSVDVGVAIALENGLVTPVIRAAESKTAREIARETKDFAARGRSRKLKQSELRGGVSTVTNLGMYGIREFAAIINPPQSSILAVGASQRRPVEGPDGAVGFVALMTVTLACDHRVIDGALAAKLLSALRELVEHPI